MAKKFNENKIKYFEEICNLEKMLEEKKSIKEIYEHMKDLVKYTYEDELNYIQITKIIDMAFEHGNQKNIGLNTDMIPQYIDLTIKRSYKRDLSYQQAFCQIYALLIALYDPDKINKKMDKDYKYKKDYIHF